MARLIGLCCFALFAACAGPPGRAFDPGHEIHVIVVTDPAPRRPLTLQVRCSVGGRAIAESQPTLGGGRPRAREVATLRAPTGKHTFSFAERTRGLAARRELNVKHEMWVVLILRPSAKAPQLEVFTRPPHAEIGTWAPRVALPN